MVVGRVERRKEEADEGRGVRWAASRWWAEHVRGGIKKKEESLKSFRM